MSETHRRRDVAKICTFVRPGPREACAAPCAGARAGGVAQAGRGASPEDRRGRNRRRAGLTESMAPLPDSLRGGRS